MRAIALAFAATCCLAIFGAEASHAQDAVTATCKDGTSWTGSRRSGACQGHRGVQAFGIPAATAAPLVAVPSAPGSTPAPTATSPVPQTSMSGAPQVWVNTASKVYHCPGDRYYGKTKAERYMTEAAARSAGDRPDHNKACSS